MATDFKSPLGLLDYLVPDQIEKMAISGFAQNPNPVNKQGNPLYGGFTPDVDPKNPTGLSNIQTLLGNAYFPQALNYGAGKGPSNKQMIDAAILRAGLEGGKGRLPGENFGAAFNRSMNAMSIPAKTLADAQLAQAKAQAALMGDGTQLSLNKIEIATGKKLLKTLAETNPDFGRRLKKLAEESGMEEWYTVDAFGIGGPSSDFYTAMANELGSVQNIYKNLSNAQLGELALTNMGGDPLGAPAKTKDNKSDKKDLGNVIK
jgi:hypothetical protein